MARLWSDEAGEDERVACARWRAEHPDHERAWQQLEVFAGKLDEVPRDIARQVLHKPAATHLSRREALRLLGVGLLGLGACELLRHSDGVQRLAADHSTRIGETRDLTLPDGTRVTLGSGTALDVRFTTGVRRLSLHAGEILVQTAHDNAAVHRPFRVHDRHGMVEALGTRFDVRVQSDTSHVSVFEGMVAVHPAHHPGATLCLNAGEGCSFDADSAAPPAPARETEAAWAQGVLIAENMRVADFVADIDRYRSGVLRCDRQVADLRVSGVFSLRNTDRALHNLTLVLPVQLVWHTRYWVSVDAA